MHPKYAALFTSVNLLLGSGPLILPAPFFEAGIVLSSIWLFVIILISYNSALFIAQSMSKIYYLKLDRERQSMLTTEELESNPPKQALLSSEEASLQRVEDTEIQSIDHGEQMILLYGYKMRVFSSLSITIYISGIAISKYIMTAKTLSKVFESVSVVSNFEFWMGIFFLCGAAFSFQSIEKTAVLQTIIIFVRALSIILMIGGAVYLVITQGMKKLTPKDGGIANFSKFTELFSNTAFALLFHHSFPGIAGQVKNSADLRFFLRGAFVISGVLIFAIPITGTMAFGDQLGSGSSSQLKYYNFDFENAIPFIYYIVSFYVFLNVASISVYVIVIRTNILALIDPTINPKKFSRNFNDNIGSTAIATAVILIVTVVVAYFARNQIQIVLDFTGGIFGNTILFIIPALEVWKARELTHRKGHKRNYIRSLPILLIMLGLVFLGYNLVETILRIIKQ